MPVNSDIRQSVILALESQGADQLAIVRDAIKQVEDQMVHLDQQQVEAIGPREYTKAVNRLVAELSSLKKSEVELVQIIDDSARQRIDAIARVERAEEAAAESQRSAQGEILRAKIDAIARQERAEEAAAERLKVLAGEVLRAKIDAIARAERAFEEASERQKVADGEAMRSRIDAIARVERAEETANAHRTELNEQLRRSDIEAMGQRAQAYARAERADEASVEHQKTAQGEILRAKIDAIARAERVAEQAAASQKAAVGEAMREKIEAYANAEREAESDDKKRAYAHAELMQQLGDEKRARIDAAVAAEDSAKRARQVVGEEMRARIDAFVATEQAAETAAKKRDQSGVQATRATKEQIQALKDLGVIQNTVATGTGNATKNVGGFATEADRAADKAKKMGYGMMNVANAAQDLQYGLGAVLNNIPLVAMAFGASPQWAAGIMVSAVAMDTLSRHSGITFNQILRDTGLAIDTSKLFGQSIAEITAKLDILKNKPHKIDLDYQRITDAERLLEVMEARLSSFNSARRDNLTEEAAKSASEATHAYGGGSEEMKKSILAYNQARGYQVNPKLAKEAEDAEKEYQESKNSPYAGQAGPGYLSGMQGRATELRDSLKKAQDEDARQTVGAFNLGDFEAIQKVQAMAKQNPKMFGRVGPGGVTAAEAIANLPSSSVETLRRIDQDEDERRREEHEQDTTSNLKDSRQRKAKAQALALQRQGVEDKAANDERTAKGKKSAEVLAAEAEAGRIGEKASRDNETARNRDQAGQNVAANKLDGGINPYLQHAFAQNRLAQTQGGGIPEAQMGAMLTRKTQGFLQANGGNPRLADEMVLKAFEDMKREFLQTQSVTGNAMQSLVAVMQQAAEAAARQGAGIAEAMAKANGMGQQQQRGRTTRRTFMPTGVL
jgi:hypothetical protein